MRAGGHNIAGNAVCDGGLLIDLSLMKSVRVDPAARTARVEPGATLADFDREAQAFGLATPLGINSTTGVAGLTLGGGFGWTTRKFGLTIDNLVSADVVTSDGAFLRASATENPDLFWALARRRRQFRRRDLVRVQAASARAAGLVGLVVHPFEEAATLLPEFRRLANEAPDELTIWAVMRKAPPLPFLPAEWHGKEVLIFAACYAGDMAEGEKATRALQRPRQADRRRHFAAPVRRLADGVRSAADPGRAQLLEEPRFRRPVGRRDRRRSCAPSAPFRRPNARCSSPMSEGRWRASRRTPRRGRTARRISS